MIVRAVRAVDEVMVRAARYSLIITDTRGHGAKVVYVTDSGIEGEELPDNGPTIASAPGLAVFVCR